MYEQALISVPVFTRVGISVAKTQKGLHCNLHDKSARKEKREKGKREKWKPKRKLYEKRKTSKREKTEVPNMQQILTS